MTDSIAKAKANLEAANAVYDAAAAGLRAFQDIEFEDRYGPLEAARCAMHSAFDCALQSIAIAKKTLKEAA